MIGFDPEEEIASDHLLEFMKTMKKWKLNCNQDELNQAIHILQLFIIKHMLQRLEAEGFSNWYDD